jgi:peptidoglycan/LPS O-acetylase OafA/YrhL
MAREELPNLTALRGICALVIVSIHLSGNFAPSWVPTFALFRPYLAVDLFFLMSGFVMAHVYGHSLVQDARRATPAFLQARFARIYPLHALTLLAVAGIVAIWPYPGSDVDFSRPTFLMQLFMVQGFSPKLSWNIPSWSVGDEVLAYCLFPLSARLLLATRHGVLIGAVCAVALFAAAARHGGMLVAESLPGVTRAVVGFTLGALLYRGWRADRARMRWLAKCLVLPLLALALFLRTDALIVLDLALVMLLVLELPFPERPGPHRVALERLGDWSYSVYLWHVPLILLVVGWAGAHAIDPARLPAGRKLVICLAILAATIVVAAASHHWAERPARRLLRPRRRAAGLEVAARRGAGGAGVVAGE